MDNSDSSTVDIAAELEALRDIYQLHGSIRAPPAVRDALSFAVTYLSGQHDASVPPPPPQLASRETPPPLQNIRYNVKINTRTTLEKLYTHDIDTLVEFPETSVSGSIGHLFRMKSGRGLYDTQYLEALFAGDPDIIADFEEDGLAVSETGPLAHTHPIPLPTKTPPHIRDELFDLMINMDHDLPDLTPRRFLRHPTTDSFLRKRLPGVHNPTLLDLHPSLANRDHIRAYIVQAQNSIFPEGTGWEGLLHMKNLQDEYLPSDEAYIRFVLEDPSLDGTHDQNDEEDEDPESDPGIPFRIAVCMTKEGSRRLLRAKYLQSDIAFRRIVGFKEFELGGLERDSRTTIVYCRIYLNRQTAAAHQMIFQKIHQIVLADTGEHLQWRHLHSTTLRDEVGILHFVLDQHGGQAKGLGLYLKSLAQLLPGKFDLHEPHRSLASLDEYDHLFRLIRLCVSHVFRNIAKSNVPEVVRNLMRSLVCMEHSDWDNTVRCIQLEGGVPGANWVADKVRSKFAFPAICWEKSFIPRTIWQVGDNTSNIIESVHADANREGISCTLLGGVKKGLHLDSLKMKTLNNWELTGVRPTYARGHISESANRGLKRKADQHHKTLLRQDTQIEAHNKRLRTAHDAMLNANERVYSTHSQSGSQVQLERVYKGAERAEDAYEKALAASKEVVGSGSGKVGLLLPSV
ncbi:hypothetical protein C8R46DRAFT_1238174 [Mycena filopes]|nr:hypothetical protein C8R46DRAFT_1238174 [Mycena filopes]